MRSYMFSINIYLKTLHTNVLIPSNSILSLIDFALIADVNFLSWHLRKHVTLLEFNAQQAKILSRCILIDEVKLVFHVDKGIKYIPLH